MYSGIYDNSKIKRDMPEYQANYTLDKTLRAIYDWYMSDENARITDDALDALEDSLVDKYYQCAKILKG